MKKKNGKGSTRTHVESLKHKDKRANIPTRELRDFVAEDEQQPKTIVFPGLLYAREPSLDLQLVWKGKEEQDQKALEVLAVLIYIQERIHPHALIEDLRVQAEERRGRIAFPFCRLQRGRISGTCRVIPA